MSPLLSSLHFPRVTFELPAVRGCISGSRSVYAAAADESAAVEEINKKLSEGEIKHDCGAF